MPTIRPRYQVTETAEVGRALDAVESTHCAAVESSSGRYPTAFDVDYLAELRQDWPD